ncbi:paraslipin [Treponema phagedenis]|uniref:Paraslipin n=1 Tax=Treponema phagedenis TaxID=162 RepID=A0A0B7H044_TREPH|nr:slipin family protein [Treponema phagedenis]EFW39458.1 SPFH/Band 7/PHB domain protein [Treponema phagedenis F0421]NVP24229.1 paraslipin [Treponema phagedenis]QEJ94204.1 paraslipin [Treponema phagedenis]QEJ99211.1 paraslipin [Treponema phagedenis]QEK00162.1 paraslipin [Treponema phagedenis]
MINYVLLYLIVIVAIAVLFKIAVVVPEKESYIVERLGKYANTLEAGFHLLVPFIDRVAYKQTLKEEALDVDPQVCITADNVQVQVDGILYLRIFDPVKASYGIENYRYAVAQLAKTTMRSQIGKMELDKTFCGREGINDSIVRALDEASDNWGIKVTRYEIRDITPSHTILEAMESQMRAEREKRANILSSEGKQQARINISLGKKQEAINKALGEKERKINIAEGKARAIEITSAATAEGLQLVAEALATPGGETAMKIRLAENYIARFKELMKNNRISIYPKDVAAVASLAAILKKAHDGGAK